MRLSDLSLSQLQDAYTNAATDAKSEVEKWKARPDPAKSSDLELSGEVKPGIDFNNAQQAIDAANAFQQLIGLKQKQLDKDVGLFGSIGRSAEKALRQTSEQTSLALAQPGYALLKGLDYPETAQSFLDFMRADAARYHKLANAPDVDVPYSDVTTTQGVGQTMKAVASNVGQVAGSSLGWMTQAGLPSLGEQVQSAQQAGVPIEDQATSSNLLMGALHGLTEMAFDPLLKATKIIPENLKSEAVRMTIGELAKKYGKALGMSGLEIPEEGLQDIITKANTLIQLKHKADPERTLTGGDIVDAVHTTLTDPSTWDQMGNMAANMASAMPALALGTGTLDVASTKWESNKPAIPEVDSGDVYSQPQAELTPHTLADKLSARGYPPAMAYGIAGNAAQESGDGAAGKLNAAATGDGGTSIGLFQWHGPRKEALEKFASDQHKDWKNVDVQLDFLEHELTTQYPELMAQLAELKSPGEVAAAFTHGFEKPADADVKAKQRAEIADQLFKEQPTKPVQASEVEPTPAEAVPPEESPTPAPAKIEQTPTEQPDIQQVIAQREDQSPIAANDNVEPPKPIAHAFRIGDKFDVGHSHIDAMLRLMDRDPEATPTYVDQNTTGDSYGYVMPDGTFMSDVAYRDKYGKAPDAYRVTKEGVAKAREANNLKAAGLTSVPGVDAEHTDNLNKFSKFVRDTIQTMAPHVKHKFTDQLGLGAYADYDRASNIMRVASSLFDDKGKRISGTNINITPHEVVWHEVLHSVRRMFTPQEWNVLTDRAKRVWRDKYNIDQNYRGLYEGQFNSNEMENALNEEAIGWAFANEYAKGQSTAPKYRKLFDKFTDFFRKVNNWARGRGFTSTLSVFDKVFKGEVGARANENAVDVNESTTMQARTEPPPPQSQALPSSTTENVGPLRKTWNYLNRNIFDPIGTLENKDDLYIEMLKTRGKAGEWARQAELFYNTFAELPLTDQTKLTTYLTNNGVGVDTLPVKVRPFAQQAKQQIEDFGLALVKRGLLDPQVYEANKGEYLPRVYLWHMLPVDQRAKFMAGGGKAKPSDAAYLKGRKWGDTPQDLLWRMSYGEVVNPGFLVAKTIGQLGRDLAILELFDKIADNADWVWRPSLTEFEGTPVSTQWLRQQAAGIRQIATNYTKDAGQRQQLMDRADRMEATANQTGEAPFDPAQFKMVPDTERYGRLRGLPIRKEIHEALLGIVQINEDTDGISQQLLKFEEKSVTWWKIAKVPLNLPSVARNWVSGLMMMNLFGDVPLHQIVPYYVKAIGEIAKDSARWKQAKQYGMKDSTYSANELYQIRDQLMQLTQTRSNIITPFSILKNNIGKGIKWITDAYGALDTFGKFATFIYHLDHGMGVEDATIKAQSALYDYGRVGRATDALRKHGLGIPFGTFTVKTAEMLMKRATTKEGFLRMLPYLAMPMLWNMTMALTTGLDDDDPKKIQKLLYDRARENPYLFLWPIPQHNGRGEKVWTFYDASPIVPLSPIVQMFTTMTEKGGPRSTVDAMARVKDMAHDLGFFSGPWVSVATALYTNRNPYNNSVLVNPNDPPQIQLAQVMSAAMNIVGPSMLQMEHVASGKPGGPIQELVRAASGENINPRTLDERKSIPQAAAGLVGMNLYNVNPSMQRGLNLQKMKQDIDDVKKRLQTVASNPNVDKEERRYLIGQYQAEIKARINLLSQYIKDTSVSSQAKR